MLQPSQWATQVQERKSTVSSAGSLHCATTRHARLHLQAIRGRGREGGLNTIRFSKRWAALALPSSCLISTAPRTFAPNPLYGRTAIGLQWVQGENEVYVVLAAMGKEGTFVWWLQWSSVLSFSWNSSPCMRPSVAVASGRLGGAFASFIPPPFLCCCSCSMDLKRKRRMWWKREMWGGLGCTRQGARPAGDGGAFGATWSSPDRSSVEKWNTLLPTSYHWHGFVLHVCSLLVCGQSWSLEVIWYHAVPSFGDGMLGFCWTSFGTKDLKWASLKRSAHRISCTGWGKKRKKGYWIIMLALDDHEAPEQTTCQSNVGESSLVWLSLST